MLNPFPELLAFGLVAPFLIRLAIGVIYIRFGYHKITTERETKRHFFEQIGLRPGILFVWIVGLIELVGGLMILIGFYTQIAAIVLSIIMLGAMLIKLRRPQLLHGGLSFYILLLIATCSLVLSGAGAFAFDLPL